MRLSQFYISHMIRSIDHVERFLSGVDKAGFMVNVEKQAAVVRMISIMGEAAKSVPDEVKERHPDVPWKRMGSMRDILVHAYFRVDLDLVWTVATVELGPLKGRLARVLEDMADDG